jgi:hypothetical protein
MYKVITPCIKPFDGVDNDINEDSIAMGSTATKPNSATSVVATPKMAEEKAAGDWERKLLLASFSNGDLLRETERRCIHPLTRHYTILHHSSPSTYATVNGVLHILHQSCYHTKISSE